MNCYLTWIFVWIISKKNYVKLFDMNCLQFERVFRNLTDWKEWCQKFWWNWFQQIFIICTCAAASYMFFRNKYFYFRSFTYSNELAISNLKSLFSAFLHYFSFIFSHMNPSFFFLQRTTQIMDQNKSFCKGFVIFVILSNKLAATRTAISHVFFSRMRRVLHNN